MGITLAETGQVLFELPIYRVTKETYKQEFYKYAEKNKQYNSDSKIETKLNKNLKKDFGGDWQYNQIIGYLEFYILGNNIRCAYYQGFDKIATRNGKRKFKIYDDTLSNVTIRDNYTNEKIIEKIRYMIDHCSIQEMIQKRYIDTKNFDNISSFVDWKSYIKKLKEKKYKKKYNSKQP